jgi:class 3 adenylate cyclase
LSGRLLERNRPSADLLRRSAAPPAADALPQAAAGRALEPAAAAKRRRITVVWALVANFGGLLLLAMLAVFALAFLSASINTIELLRDRAEQTITLLTARLREHLDLPATQLKLLGQAIADKRVTPDNQAEFERLLEGALSGLPQLLALSFVDTSLKAVAAQRIDGTISIQRLDLGTDAAVRELLRSASTHAEPSWSAPVWRPQIGSTVITVVQPATRDGRPLGAFVALIGIEEISAYVARLGREVNATAFILYGRDRVLGHANLRTQIASVSAESPLPMLNELGDPILAALWDDRFQRAGLIRARDPIRSRTIGIGGDIYPFFYTELAGYSDKALIVGVYGRAADFGAVIERLIWSFVAGAVAIVLAIILAVLIGRRLARPVRRMSEAAALVGELKMSDVQPLPPSRIREIDEQARAFNSMVGALRWFEAYVPRPVARHLLKSGDTKSIESDERNLTVLFTDIVGFSTFSQGQTAADVAAFLNQHFALVIRCVEQEQGTVDKFIGDCVMAYWGAPEKIKNRAERACRAALAIRSAIEADNDERAAQGLPAVRMRIGIHSGDATVGNIGSPERINYTIIGDMVNVGQRIEQLAKEIGPQDQTVAILISEATRADLGPEFQPRALGKHPLRGREGLMEVFAL